MAAPSTRRSGIGVPFLGAVPLHMDIRETSDAGTPVVVAEPDGEHAQIFIAMQPPGRRAPGRASTADSRRAS